MKKLSNTNVAMLLLIFLMIACSKDAKLEDQKAKALSPAEMQNSANPFDEQGKMYNEFLSIATKDSTKPKRRTLSGWDVSKLAQNNGDIGGWEVGQIAQILENNDIGGWDVGQVMSAAMNYYGSKGKDSGDEAKSKLSMQLEAFSGMPIDIEDECWYHPDRCKDKSVVNPVDILKSAHGGTLHERTTKYINAVRDQEAKLISNADLTEDEKRDFLICLSIARHAAGFWYNETRDYKPNGNFSMGMIHLATLGASNAIVATGDTNAGVATAILGAYIARNVK